MISFYEKGAETHVRSDKKSLNVGRVEISWLDLYNFVMTNKDEINKFVEENKTDFSQSEK